MNDRTRTLRCALALAAPALAAVAQADRADDLVRVDMASHHIPGATLAVVQDGKVVKQGAYGLANVELGVKTKLNTLFEIGSVTKQFTATLIMMLVEAGKLDLDAPVGALLPKAPAAWEGITLRKLLGHTSGLKNINDLPGFELHENLTSAKFVERLGSQPLEFKPGDKYAYRNTGYALAGYVVESICGKPYWQVLRERIFEPLGMSASRDRDPRAIVHARSSGYEWVDGKLFNRGTNLTDISSAGAILSNIPDLIKWNAAIDSGRLLEKENLALMWTAGRLNNGKPTGYGLGWGVGAYRGEKLISHGGSTAGFSASICKFVDRKLTVIVLTNCETLNNAGDLARAIAGLYIEFPKR